MHNTIPTKRLTAFVILAALLLLFHGFARPAALTAAGASIDPQVYAALAAAADGQATFLVSFSERADLSAAAAIGDWAARGQYVMERLQAAALAAQAPVLERLSQRSLEGQVTGYQSFWIANVIVVTGDRAAAEWLARQPGVAAILPELRLDPPEQPDDPSTAGITPDAPAWGVAKINADDVWNLGYTGQGMVVGLVDTGVQWDHPALKNHYRGWNGSTANHNYSWYDPANFCGVAGSAPCDSDGHGTHTTGTTTGGITGNEIGVAPGAKWIHAAGCCASNASLLSSLQWMAAPTDMVGNNPDPSKRPNVVNNSWGGPGGSMIFSEVIANLRAAGIVPVFSAGNNGSACGTLGSPGDNLTAFNVGATSNTDAIAPFSSRGSNPFNGSTDPDVTAPGINVCSSVPGSAYSCAYSGTSMAAPHVAGAVALILSAEPDLLGKVDQIEELLRKTAVPLTTASQTCGGVPGSQVPNNTFGWGRIDVLAAVNMVLNAGTLSGVVTDAVTSAPIAGATVSITRNSQTLMQKTAADGSYSFVAGAGTYQVKAEAFGYTAQTIAGITVVKDVVTTRNFALGTLATGSISGTVLRLDTSAPVSGATVALVGTTLSATTGANGAYALANVPFGTYTARMTSPGFQTLTTANVIVDGPKTLNFTPAAVADYVMGDGGDTCSIEYSWVDAITSGAVYNLGDDSFASVTLPWIFTFYGNNYSNVYVSSNGFISFGAGYSTWHGIVPFEGAPNNQIIGFGEDLNPANGSQGKIYTKNLMDGRFVIEYYQVQHWASGYPETFEIILDNNEDTIVVQYHTVSWPDFANAGIENSDGSRGILYSYANNPPLTTGLAVKYTPFTGQAPVCVPAAAPVVSITGDFRPHVRLQWNHVAPNTTYQVWRHTTPYFEPASQGELIATLYPKTNPLIHQDPNRIGDPTVNYFYVARGVLAGGASGPSNRVGEFDYALTPGQ